MKRFSHDIIEYKPGSYLQDSTIGKIFLVMGHYTYTPKNELPKYIKVAKIYI